METNITNVSAILTFLTIIAKERNSNQIKCGFGKKKCTNSFAYILLLLLVDGNKIIRVKSGIEQVILSVPLKFSPKNNYETSQVRSRFKNYIQGILKKSLYFYYTFILKIKIKSRVSFYLIFIFFSKLNRNHYQIAINKLPKSNNCVSHYQFTKIVEYSSVKWNLSIYTLSKFSGT